MNKWLLAGIYSAPVAALAVASTVSTSKLSTGGFFDASNNRSAISLSAFNEGLQKRSVLVERTSEKSAPNEIRIVRLTETPASTATKLEELELVEVNSTSDGSGPKLVFARSSASVFDKAANSISPQGFSLVRNSLEKSGPALASPRFNGFQSAASSSASNSVLAGDLGIDGALPDGESTSIFQDQFDEREDAPTAVTTVPLPAGIPLLLSALAFFGLASRKSRK